MDRLAGKADAHAGGRAAVRALAAAAVLSAAWAATQTSGGTDTDTAANTVPTLTVADVRVRPARSFAAPVAATDPDADPADAARGEPVRLQAVLELSEGQTRPAWLEASWELAAAPDPGLTIGGTVAADAAPATYRISVTATDSRGLTASAAFDIEVLAPRCTGAVEYAPNLADACAACPEHGMPDVSKTACVKCAQDTQRTTGATVCTACAADEFSVAGGACEAKNRAPSFAQATGTKTVRENAAPGTALGGALNATDPEDDVLAYTLDDASGLFSVDDDAGRIRIAAGAVVDHESAASHTLTLQVADSMDERRDGDAAVDDTMAVTVAVTDVNEPPATPAPVAAASGPTSLRVTWAEPENTGPPITRYVVRHKEDRRGARATDANVRCTPTPCSGAWEITDLAESTAYRVRMRAFNDEGQSGLSPWADARTYAELAVSFGSAAYAVDEGGELTVTLRLDRASDRALTVPLTVSPASGYAVTAAAFAAGGTTATAVFEAAVDADRDDATATLGFGTLPAGVSAGPPSSATVAVTDVGSNAEPDFGYLAATRTVAESVAPGERVGTFTATDADDDTLTYSLADASGLFALDAMSGRLRLAVDATLDHETAASHGMAVGVSDGRDLLGAPDTAVDDTIAVTVWVSDVDEPPAIPDPPQLAATGTTSLEASWTAPANSGPRITRYVLRYRKAAGGVTTDVAVQCPEQGSCPLSRTLADLEPGVGYRVRVRAVNDEGCGDFSGWRNATTHRSLALSFGISAYALDEGAEATVSAVLDQAADRALSIPLSVDPPDGLTLAPEAFAFAVGDAEATAVLTAALDADGDDGTAVLRFGELPEGVAVQSPTTAAVRVTDLGNNTAPVFADAAPVREVAEDHAAGTPFGAPVSAADAEGDALAYSLTDASGLFAVNASSGRLLLASGAGLDFESAASHAVTVHVSDRKDGRGNADASVDASVAVAVAVADVDEPPGRPPKPAVETLGTTSLRVSWTAPENDGPPIGGYVLQYRENRADADTESLDLPCASDGTCPLSADVGGLNPGTDHLARLRPRNAEGEGRASPWGDGTTHRALTASYAPAAYEATGGGSVTVTVELDQAADRALAVPLTATAAGTDTAYVLQPGQVDIAVDATSAAAVFVAPADAPTETVALGFGTLPSGVTAGAGATVSVSAAMVNRPPVFPASATVSVAEDAGSGDPAGGVLAANDPEDDALAYTLSDAAVPFAVSAVAAGAQLSVAGGLDHETAPSYVFKVYASDRMDAMGGDDDAVDAEISVTVTVTDVDEPPATVAAPQATVLGTDGVRVAWSPPAANGGPALAGYVVVHEKADGTDAGETDVPCAGGTCPATADVAGLGAGTPYRFAVVAYNDEGRGTPSPWTPATTHRRLAVSFAAAAYTVDEGASVDVAVQLDQPADRDLAVPLAASGDTDSFAVPAQVAFAIGDRTAAVAVGAAADDNFASESVTLSFGTPLPAGVAAGSPDTATVTVDDGNRPAMFAEETKTFTVEEDHAAGTALGPALTATDPDDDPLTYSFAGASEPFELDGSEIGLKPGAGLDHETATSHMLTVQVTDGKDAAGDPDPAVDDDVVVTITVTDVDEAPSFGGATVPDQAYTVGVAISPLTLPAATGGDTAAKHSLSPALVDGLLFDGPARILSGTPAAVSEAAAYTYTATDDDGTADPADDETASLTFRIAVAGASCAAEVSELCSLGESSSGETSGACATGSTGSCEYRCDDGSWTEVSNTCVPDRTLTVARAAGGTVASAPEGVDCGPSATDCSADFANDTEVTLTAVAAAAHTFAGWTGDCTGTAATATVTMDADRSCGAAFEPDRTLAVSPRPGNGYVTGTGIDCGSGSRDDCTETVAHGTEVALAATADTGYELTNWTGACSGTGSCTVELTADRTVGATFGKVRRTLTVSPEPANGNVAGGGIDCGATGDTCRVSLDAGTSIMLAATPADGYEVTGWTGACTSAGTATTCIVVLDADATAGTTFGERGCVDALRTWTVGGVECSARVWAAASGATEPVADSGYPTTGSATFACTRGTWTEEAGSSCVSCTPVDGGWTGWSACSATTCGQTGTRTRSCTNPEAACGGAQCAGADSATCTGDRCASGHYCGAGACVAYSGSWRTGTWGACSTTACGGLGQRSRSVDCVGGPCDPATEPSAIGSCYGTACGAGEHCTGSEAAAGTCEPDPVCDNTEPLCVEPRGRGTDLPDTPPENGACYSTELQGCSAGTFRDPRDTELQDGVCGTSIDDCTGGHAANTNNDTARQNRWDCLGFDAAKRWTCVGTDGIRNWSCTSGTATKACTASGTAATDRNCVEVVDDASHDLGCFTCKACPAANEVPDADDNCACVCADGHEEFDGACVPECDMNEVRDDEGGCVCDAGHERDGGACVPKDCGAATRSGCVLPGTSHGATGAGSCGAGYQKADCGASCSLGAFGAPSPACAACGENEVNDDDGDCVCDAGHERDGGACVPKDCGAATRSGCVLPGTSHGATGAGSCGAGYQKADCGASCSLGAFGAPSPACAACGENEVNDDDGDCVCDAGHERDGGACVPKDCGAATESGCVLPGTSHGATGAGSCGAGYQKADCGASCSLGAFGAPSPACVACGPNEVNDDDGDCVCDAGHERDGGACVPKDCGAATRSGCVLPGTSDGATGAGSCGAGYQKADCGASCSLGAFGAPSPACAACGENEVNDDDGDCVCDAGHERDGGACVPKDCGAATRSGCVLPGTSHGATGAGSCGAGYQKADCGASCSLGAFGAPSPACAACGENEVNDDDGDCVCDAGHEEYGGACVPVCGANEVRNNDGACECRPGYHEHNGVCVDPCGNVACLDGECNRWSDDDTGSCAAGASWQDVDDTETHWWWRCAIGAATKDCKHRRPDGGQCQAATLVWTVDSRNCYASAGRTSHGGDAMLRDDSMDELSRPTGSATFTCEDGEWTEAPGATCDCGAQCGCLSIGGTWIEARPERVRTCTGNNGCTNHSHSCTTPVDPDGGYLSCTYKKHKGGFSCTSHSHATCEPYPAADAHCHVDIGDICPICDPFQ